MQTLFQNDYDPTRRRVHLQLFGTDGVSPATTEAGGQPSLSLGGNAPATANCGVLVAVDAAKGLYYTELTLAGTAVRGRARVIYGSATAAVVDELIEVIPHPYLHDGVAQAGGSGSITLAGAASAVDSIYRGGYVRIVAGVGVGQVRQITDYVGATRLATVDRDWVTQPDATSEYVVEPGAEVPSLAEVWDADTSVHQEPGTFGEATAPLRRGTAQGGGANTITLDAQASAFNDFYAKTIIRIVAGTGAGQSNIINTYAGATKIATVAANWAVVPDATSVFVLLPFGPIPGATAPTAPEVAAAVWDEALAAHVVNGSFGAGVRLEPNTPAVVADAFLKRSVSGGEDGFPSVEFALCFLAGKWTDNGNGTITVFAADDTTPLGTISYSTRPRDAIGSVDSAAA